jgi:hypothetical protein
VSDSDMIYDKTAVDMLNDKIARLEAECAALKADAERYRFIKSGDYNMRLWDALGEISGDSWDDEIDNAIETGEKP